jgi:hypothetical protein
MLRGDRSSANTFAGSTGSGGDKLPTNTRASIEPGAWIAGRYRVEGTLGSGGMARVYRVTDNASGRDLALKLLFVSTPAVTALFEREFHTLIQLSHPRVIEVYDFGVDRQGSFYTMELLDGGDLRERSPCNWRVACALLFDVCSSLALLHSRRLVHRDVTPRNVRCTRAGHAKLIDFGAMEPMGRCDTLVGTPAFIAPEVLSRLTMDGRTDLYSFGATLYYALTGAVPYPARDFQELRDAWQQRPLPPSYYAPDVPESLDTLVLSLLEIQNEMRPRGTFEVMQRLAGIAGLAEPEVVDVAQAYLSTPSLVGRDETLSVIGQVLDDTRRTGRGAALLIRGPRRIGRSRVLDAAVTRAKIVGALVLRVSANGSGAGAGLRVLIEQLLLSVPGAAQALAVELDAVSAGEQVATKPERQAFDVLELPRAERQRLLLSLITGFAQRHTIVIAVDDVARMDEPSRALLTAFVDAAPRHRMLVVVTQESTVEAGASTALALLATLCTPLPLPPLDYLQTQALMSSVFGDVPNLQLISQRVFSRTQGNPGLALELVQYLVDAGRVVYHRGGWTLPSDLDDVDLPLGDQALVRRLAQANEVARALLGAHALSLHDGFTRDEYRLLLPQGEAGAIDAAIDRLLAQQILASDGRSFWLTHRVVGSWFLPRLTLEEARSCHIGLVNVYAQRAASPMLLARHCLMGELFERGLAILLQTLAQAKDAELLAEASGLDADQICAVLDLALSAAERFERAPRELAELRSWLSTVSAAADPNYHRRAAAGWRAQLERDSGWCYLQEPDQSGDAGERLTRALMRASATYEETPVALRVYRPDEAIRNVAHYVAASVALGTRVYDGALLSSLPALLEPFAVLSPILHAMWQNSLAAFEISQPWSVLKARRRWLSALEHLPEEASGELSFVVRKIRGGIAFALGLLDARIGLQSAEQWLTMLDADRLHSVNAMYLRKIIRLQYGDLAGAEHCRRQAELLSLQGGSIQLFTNTLAVELFAHSLARDIEGVKAIRERIRPLAARHPGWKPFEHLAEAQFQALAGDRPRALSEVERALSLATPDVNEPQRVSLAWPASVALYLELLTEADRVQEAIDYGVRALAGSSPLTQADAGEMDVSAHPIVRALAQAEAKALKFECAIERISAIVAQQLALGAQGMHLGAAYEVRARIAACAGDSEGFEHYAQLTLQEYRRVPGSALAARHTALLSEESALAGFNSRGAAFVSTTRTHQYLTSQRTAAALIEQEMSDAADRSERARRALQIVCDAHRAYAGQLYLCCDSGVELVASQGTEALPRDLALDVSRLIQRELEADDMATVAAERDASLRPRANASLHVLTTRFNDRDMIVGVVAMADGTAIDAAKRTQLLQALAGYLLRAGDAIAASAADA